MARKQLVPPGTKRGGRGKPPPFPPVANGKSTGKAPPVAAKGKGGAARGAPLPSPPPRKRTAPAMPLPTGNPTPVMRTPAVAVHIMPPAEAAEMSGRLGPAMSAAAGSSPKRRAVAQAMRGGRMAF